MSVECYLCELGVDLVPDKSSGKIVGVCKKCHVMACDAHAVRDGNFPRWICGICDTSILAVSAVLSEDGIALKNPLIALVSSAAAQEGADYQTLEAFIGDRNNLVWLKNRVNYVINVIENRFNPAAREAFHSLTSEGQRMMAAAIQLASDSSIPDGELMEVLRRFVVEWRAANGG